MLDQTELGLYLTDLVLVQQLWNLAPTELVFGQLVVEISTTALVSDQLVILALGMGLALFQMHMTLILKGLDFVSLQFVVLQTDFWSV